MYYYDVAIPINLDTLLTYASETPVAAGTRVAVKVRKKATVGIVIAEATKIREGIEYKQIARVLDDRPILGKAAIELLRWVSDYYMTPLNQTLGFAVPGYLLNDPIVIAERFKDLDPKPIVIDPVAFKPLSPDQQRAYESVRSRIGTFAPTLLYGVTGSGKTEVFVSLIRDCIEAGRSALVLVPEISLTPLLVRRFTRWFGDGINLIHSRLGPKHRAANWLRAGAGAPTIVIGVRSTVFAPVSDLGIIIVDEEHDQSYKQQDTAPFYSARDIAVMRAKMAGIPIVLASATPSVESYVNATTGAYALERLEGRFADAPMPAIIVASPSSHEYRPDGPRLPWYLSDRLYEEIGVNLEKMEQTIIFQNRRGYSSSVICQGCGYVPECRNCKVLLTYHKDRKRFVCHHCGYVERGYDTCPKCGGDKVNYVGVGTQRITEDLATLFPAARIARIDGDLAAKKGYLEGVFDAFEKGETDILVGTQIISKGHHFPALTLVGVIFADSRLALSDFRGAERMYQQIVQVSGRAGRADLPGRVVLQSFTTNDPVIEFIKANDYFGFVAAEQEDRKPLNYPPFGHLANIRISSKRKDAAPLESFVRDFTTFAAKAKLADVQLLGPVKSPLELIRNRVRYQLLVKARSRSARTAAIVAIRKFVAPYVEKGSVTIAYDIDPIDFV